MAQSEPTVCECYVACLCVCTCVVIGDCFMAACLSVILGEKNENNIKRNCSHVMNL